MDLVIPLSCSPSLLTPSSDLPLPTSQSLLFSDSLSSFPLSFSRNKTSQFQVIGLAFGLQKPTTTPLTLRAWTQDHERSLQQQLHDDPPVSIQLHPICSDTQFDRVLAEAQQLEESIIIVWMASWCRKCIYLKPKLEKLAADYYPRLQFYCVDVNTVPHKLITRAGVTKMPTIQLWKDGRKQAEVIGGYKAHVVISEVREMIENESTG